MGIRDRCMFDQGRPVMHNVITRHRKWRDVIWPMTDRAVLAKNGRDVPRVVRRCAGGRGQKATRQWRPDKRDGLVMDETFQRGVKIGMSPTGRSGDFQLAPVGDSEFRRLDDDDLASMR